jgi:hypothetical protein
MHGSVLSNNVPQQFYKAVYWVIIIETISPEVDHA